MRRDPCRKRRPVTNPLHNTRDKRRAAELIHLARHADVGVDERLVVNDEVLVGRGGVGAALEPVGRAPKQVLEDGALDKVQERDDGQRPRLRPRRLADQEEVEQLDADGVALDVESVRGNPRSVGVGGEGRRGGRGRTVSRGPRCP